VGVDKSLSLVGENRDNTTIRGIDPLRGVVVYVGADNVNITGFTVRNSGTSQYYYSGILLDTVSNCSVYDNCLTSNNAGIFLWECSACSISNNNLTANAGQTLYLQNCSACSISGNTVMTNNEGIWLNYSSSCSLFNNTIGNNQIGVELYNCSNCSMYRNSLVQNNYGMNVTVTTTNKIIHNSFINNTVAQAIADNIGRFWDDGYPGAGNYWSNQNTTDSCSGPYQNETGSDGITDSPHIIDGFNRDRYPLTKPFDEFNHDVAVFNATPAQAQVDGGQPLIISATVGNLGEIAETFNVTAFANEANVAVATVPYVIPSENQTISLIWNTVGTTPDTYSIKAVASQVPGETFLDNNVYVDGSVEIRPAHDIAATSITPQRTLIGQGYSLTFNVSVLNKGTFIESFNVILYADKNVTILGDEITIGTKAVSLLTNATSTLVTFTWNTTGVPMGNYTISAYAGPVPYETNTADNNCTDGVVHVCVPGDVDGNGLVNMLDLYTMALHYGTTIGQTDYVMVCDIDNNGIINMIDLYIGALHYGQTGP
jgi:parallel beta-helix repeat protein